MEKNGQTAKVFAGNGTINGPAARRLASLRDKQAQEQATMDVDDPLTQEAVEAMDWASMPSSSQPLRKGALLTDYYAGLNHTAKHEFVILDTCIYIGYPVVVERMFQFVADPANRTVLVLPYVILKELNKLKHQNGKPQCEIRARAANHAIAKELSKELPNIKLQHPRDELCKLMHVSSSDDAILNCALQITTNTATNDGIVLVSEDVNLRMKASAAKIVARTSEAQLQAME